MVGTRSVLVLEADECRRETHASWLADYHVQVAGNPVDAREKLNRAIDVVLVSKRLATTLSLAEIRSRTGGCHVVAITPLSATARCSLDGVDASLARPTTRDELVETVDRFLTKTAYDRRLRSFYSQAAMKAELEAELDGERLTESTGYERVCQRVRELKAELGETVENVETDWSDLFTVCRPAESGDERTPVA